MLRHTRIIIVVLLAIGLIELLVSLAAFLMLGSEDQITAAANADGRPSTTQPTNAPATAPAKPTSWDIPALVSPAAIAPAIDPNLAKLFDQHNANQSRIASATLTAQCTWTLDTKGEARPMTIRYQRQGEKADMTCGNDRCSVEMGHVKMAPGSALNVDALYLLMFRKFDGRSFKPAKADKPGMVRAVSPVETLDFDAASGHLVRAEIHAKEGTVITAFADYAPLKDDPAALIPTTIDILVPSDMYPFYRAADGKISLRVATN